jgi:hypothetical protein
MTHILAELSSLRNRSRKGQANGGRSSIDGAVSALEEAELTPAALVDRRVTGPSRSRSEQLRRSPVLQDGFTTWAAAAVEKSPLRLREQIGLIVAHGATLC